jgi:integrase
MAITFFTQSKKENSPIWIRVREGKIDAKARTLEWIKTDRLVKGDIKDYKIIASDDAEQKAIKRRDNDSLHIIKKELEGLRSIVYDALNERKEGGSITSQWLKNIVQPNDKAKLFNIHIDAFLDYKRHNLRPNSLLIYTQSGGVLKEYQKDINEEVALVNIDMNFKVSFEAYLRDKGYSNSSIILYIGRLVQILKYAEKLRHKVSDDIGYFKDGLKKKKTLNIYLSFDEIQLIHELDIDDQRDDIARDWLVISCNTAQRASDLFAFDKKNISRDGDYLKVQQTKNENSKPIELPLLPQVKEILEKYNGNFPPLFSKNPETNYTIYNRAIKRVGRRAKLDEVSKTLISKAVRGASAIVEKEKWKLITSHIGRRSFATNYYGKVPTALIQSITGHLTESSFLLYIDRARIIDKEDLMAQLINASS